MLTQWLRSVARPACAAAVVLSSSAAHGEFQEWGTSLRRSVVRGAQIADALDARWDELSYRLRGSPKPTDRPSRGPLDAALVRDVRATADVSAADVAGVQRPELEAMVRARVAKFATVIDDDYALDTYAAFRAYNDLGVDPSRFEALYGRRVLEIFGGARVADVHDKPRLVVDEIRRLLAQFEERGLASRVDVVIDDDRLDEVASRPWGVKASDPVDAAPLQVSATLYDAPELGARVLLETQSRRLNLRLLPNLAATVLSTYLAACCEEPPTIETYFVDTQYRTAFERDNYAALQLEILLP